MILNTKGKLIRDILANRAGKGFPADVVKVARRKLSMLDSASEVEDLRVPPANRLEALKGRQERAALDPGERSVALLFRLDRRRPRRG